ncbi:GntR family transcriptional regulator [Herbaspirillum sp. RTI4]|uniref:FadR/GntR family transcriptional regulator n=1 Tax=Herbaspirillum sp. RTI4 TaxID=3048640 RepID=UPI002AB4A3F7|nr:FCD domain-containing protein [Herbaspirillum sp. RTI4]MDY7578851.1 GntR family transcriptional regulator [Herbaspirillum sp. RTI4]MEA9982994.1 GntR family transcriptional regulator [Herbaspirillum sp. RTI4]
MAKTRLTVTGGIPKPDDSAREAKAALSPEILALSASGMGPIRTDRFAERVYEHLFHAIVEGKIAVGSRLPSENDLAALFDVSRPIVRQALDRLREDKMVESIRGSGTYVKQAAGNEQASGEPAQRIGHILNGLELRLVMEPECAFMAALRRRTSDLETMDRMLCGFEEANASGGIAHHFDFGFHEAIAAATANARLVQVMKSLEYDISHAVNLLRHLVHIQPWERTQDAIDEHRNLFQLIKIQDAEGARRAMRGHLENARTRMFNSRPGL